MEQAAREAKLRAEAEAARARAREEEEKRKAEEAAAKAAARAAAREAGGEARALNVLTHLVKLDELLMNLSPNLIRDRRTPYLTIVKCN